MSQPSQPITADNAVQMLTEDEDDVYFGSYAHFSIHQEMLKVFMILFMLQHWCRYTCRAHLVSKHIWLLHADLKLPVFRKICFRKWK
jgi:hypothetical protein